MTIPASLDTIPINAILPLMWERLEGSRFYIGSTCVGTLEGSRELGYIYRPIANGRNRGNGYARNITRALSRLRNEYWYRTGRGI